MHVKDSRTKQRKHKPGDQPGEEAAKIERIAGHTAGLVEDLKLWFELKIEYAVLEFKEEIKATGLQFAYHAGFIAVLLVALLFGLTAAAFGIGAWLGHPAWGFLVVTVLLVLAAFIVKWIGDRRKKETVEPLTYRVKDAQQQLPPGTPGASDPGDPGVNKPAPNGQPARDPALLNTPEPTQTHDGKDD